MSLIPKELPENANRQWITTAQPVIEPITVDELKEFARIDGSDEDTLIAGFIKAVREATELYLGRALITQTIRMILDYWPKDVIELPQPPLISITSVETVDEDDATTTYSSDNYYAVVEAIPGYIAIKRSVTRPENTDRYHGGYRITFVAGYGPLATDVPQNIIEAMKLWATSVYENRAIETDPPPEARPLLDLYKVIKY